MAIPFSNYGAVNSALGKLGSSYRLGENGTEPTYAPTQQTAAPATAAPQDQTITPGNHMLDAGISDPDAISTGQPQMSAPSQQSGWDKAKTAETMKGIQDASQAQNDAGMKKLGTLVGTVLSFYTGQYGKGAQGLQSLGNQNQESAGKQDATSEKNSQMIGSLMGMMGG